MKRKTKGIIQIALGFLLSFSSVGMFAVYEYQAEIAGDHAQFLVEELHLEQSVDSAVPYVPAKEEPAKGEMLRTTLNGYDLIGMLQIPSVGLELPVLDQWSYDLLQVAPCRYSGSVQEGNLILLAHNYKRHFGPLKQLTVGDRIVFISVDGTRYEYQVAEQEVLQKTELERLTGSDYDLTLFTCTNGGYSRLVVRCSRVPNQ